jgi:hypothetical protein
MLVAAQENGVIVVTGTGKIQLNMADPAVSSSYQLAMEEVKKAAVLQSKENKKKKKGAKTGLWFAGKKPRNPPANSFSSPANSFSSAPTVETGETPVPARSFTPDSASIAALDMGSILEAQLAQVDEAATPRESVSTVEEATEEAAAETEFAPLPDQIEPKGPPPLPELAYIDRYVAPASPTPQATAVEPKGEEMVEEKRSWLGAIAGSLFGY